MQRKPKTGMRRNAKETVISHKRSRHLDGVTVIAENDHELLRRFVTEHGKIIPARLTGASSKQQRQIKRGVRRARVMGLIG